MRGVERREAAGAALAFAAVVLLSFADGGFFPNAWRAGALAFACAAGLALVASGPRRPTRAEALLVGGLAAFALWAAVSAAWSIDPDASLLDAQRTLLYVAAAVAALLVRGALLAGTLAGVVAVCVYSVSERLVRGEPEPPDPLQGTLLYEPLGYANGLGALAAFGIPLAVGLLGRRPVLLAAVLTPLLGVLVLTGSRAAMIAAVAGAAVTAALRWGSPSAVRGIVAAAAAALALALVLPAGSLADDLAPHAGQRAWYWHVAWGDVGEAPVVGRGSGTFALSWAEEQPVPQSVRDAHSLYLETLAELGLVGLALVALALAPPLVAALRRPAAPAAAGAYVAFCLHAGLDWDWELPAVTVTGLLCGCALLLAHERKKSVPLPSTPGTVTIDKRNVRS